jgi:hypothetical protein
MCNLYSQTKGQQAIIALTKAMRDKAGNLPPLPGIFPDYQAPVVRNAPDGVRELAMLRWGMPSHGAVFPFLPTKWLLVPVAWSIACCSMRCWYHCLRCWLSGLGDDGPPE